MTSEMNVQNISLNKIKLGRNSRLNVKDEEIAGLMESIKETGLLQPIGVVKSTKGYEICYGNRRFLAVSKLGLSSIPAVILEDQDAKDIDIKNLTENLQRKNVTLVEAGRYFEILKNEGMSAKEMAVKVGVPYSFVKACLDSYQNVPNEYRDKIQIRMSSSNQKIIPGMIPLSSAQKINTAIASYGLSKTKGKALYKAAVERDDFNVANVKKYAAAIKADKKDPIGSVTNLIHINIRVWLTETEHARLERKYVNDGPYKSVSGVAAAVLRGEISETIKNTV